MSEAAAKLATDTFRKLYLPVPEQGEFIDAFAQSYLVYVPDYNIIIRLNNKRPPDMPRFELEVERLNHPALLKTLGTFENDDLLIEICPTVQPGVSIEDANFLREWLKKDGVHPRDIRPENCGYLPFYSDQFPWGHPIIFDLGAVNTPELIADYWARNPELADKLDTPLQFMHAGIDMQDREKMWSANAPIPYDVIQNHLYQHLIDQFNACDNDYRPFMESCRTSNALAGKMDVLDTKSYKSETNKYTKLHSAAERYAAKVKSNDGFFRL